MTALKPNHDNMMSEPKILDALEKVAALLKI